MVFVKILWPLASLQFISEVLVWNTSQLTESNNPHVSFLFIYRMEKAGRTLRPQEKIFQNIWKNPHV